MSGTWMKALLATVAVSACASVPDAALAPAHQVRAPQVEDQYFTAGAARIAGVAQTARAKNVILFIGDGMGISTVTAARIFAGQRLGVDGESFNLTMDTFPHSAFSRTYSHDSQISESSSTATALVTGVKTRSGGIGMTIAQMDGTCADAAAVRANAAKTIFELAEDAGLATGVVSTARITHATPASVYSHVPNRNWENDAEVARSNVGACPDIARQLVEWPYGDGLELALGGGRANFLPSTMTDPEHAEIMGARADGRNLAAEWAAKPGHAYVWNTQQLNAAPRDARVLALFSPSHMAYENDRARDPGGEPSLSEMTAAAISRLSQHDEGYVLMIEGGRIDHAHHEGRAGEALSETIAYDEAVKTALAMTSRDDTLIVVTADHSHTLTISGYAQRGNPILGLSANNGQPARAQDGKPYTTLGYANGPGSVYAEGATPAARPDLTGIDTTAQGFHQQTLVPLGSETHAGEDVPLYAWGPGDAMFSGTIEQNVVFHAMARALGFEISKSE